MPDRGVYLTREGFARLEEERKQLLTIKRPLVSERLRKAKEGTDTVDNAEYDDAKSELSFIDGRIQELEGLLAAAEMIADEPHTDYVTLGSHVVVKDEDGETEKYMIVGSAEAEPRKGRVSNESPIGRALMGKRKGERTSVVAPGGNFELVVVEVN